MDSSKILKPLITKVEGNSSGRLHYSYYYVALKNEMVVQIFKRDNEWWLDMPKDIVVKGNINVYLRGHVRSFLRAGNKTKEEVIELCTSALLDNGYRILTENEANLL